MTIEHFRKKLKDLKIKIHNERSILLADVDLMLTKPEQIKFKEWIRGQTGELIKGKFAVYFWDLKRFLELIREGKPTYFD